MGNLNVIVAGSKDFAGNVGKKGTVTDMTFYEIKKGNDSITLIEPSKYPEKLSSLFYSVAMAEYALRLLSQRGINCGIPPLSRCSIAISPSHLVKNFFTL